ncbi:MAG: deoxyribose-phosphate aldolase [Candidatus Cloacimonetes bacterium]|nr:deoxyribose-phosphate aldolase [Candidatus Cloacimonadota bacterium]
MENIRDLFVEIFEINRAEPSRCGGSHEVCLQCAVCRAEGPDQLVGDLDNLAQYIDHTNLKPDASQHAIKKLCREAATHGFKSVCVNPSNVELASFQLTHTAVCSVVGFPLGASLTEIKVHETAKAIEQGAGEIDMVINLGCLRSKHYKDLLNDIATVAAVCHKKDVLLKVIIETCYLNNTEKIIACLVAKKAGADFVKTSTGFGSGGATLDDVALMREVVGPKIGVKAAGGIRDTATTRNMLKAGANRIGASQSISIIR